MVVLAPLRGSVQALSPDVRVVAFLGWKSQGSYHVIDDPHRISDGAGLEAHAGHAGDQFLDCDVAVAKGIKLDALNLRGSLRDCIRWCEDRAYSGRRYFIGCFVILITTSRHESVSRLFSVLLIEERCRSGISYNNQVCYRLPYRTEYEVLGTAYTHRHVDMLPR